MSNAISWAPTLASVDAAMVTATGADKTVGQSIRSTLAAAGANYDTRYATAGVDDAKGAWLTAADAAHLEADRACRYYEDVAGTPDAALPFDPWSAAAILARIETAKGKASASGVQALEAHAVAVSGAYANPTGATLYQSFARPPQFPPTVVENAYTGPKCAVLNPSSRTHQPSLIVDDPASVRSIELDSLRPAISAATEWLALVAYP